MDTCLKVTTEAIPSDDEEMELTEHVQTLTSFADLSSLANTQVEGLFVTRVLDKRNFWSAAQYGHEAGDF